MQSIRFLLLGVFALMPSLVFAQTSLVRPVISHDPPRSVVQGRSLRILAEVKSQRPVEEVTLFLAQSAGAEPVQFNMNRAGSGVYTVQVGSAYFTGLKSFRYYITAKDNKGAWSETNWVTVQVVGATTSTNQKEQAEWVRPALIGAGAVAAVGVGVAVSGGGGGGSGGNGGDGNDGGGDPADQVIVRSVSDRVQAASVALPDVTQVDAAGELGGRTLSRVRIRLEFNAVDAGPEQVQVVYNGSTVLSRTVSDQTVDQIDVVGGDNSQVTIQVVSSTPEGGQNQYQWSATVTYFVD